MISLYCCHYIDGLVLHWLWVICAVPKGKSIIGLVSGFVCKRIENCNFGQFWVERVFDVFRPISWGIEFQYLVLPPRAATTAAIRLGIDSYRLLMIFVISASHIECIVSKTLSHSSSLEFAVRSFFSLSLR